MLRVSTIWAKYSLMKRIIPIANTKSSSLVLTSNTSLLWLRKMSSQEAEPKTQNMPGQHDKLPSDFPTTATPPITTPTDAPLAVEDSPFVPDFDAIPPIRPGEDPPTPSPSPTAPRIDSPEFSEPPNTSPPSHEAPRPPTSPPGQPEAFPPHAPDARPPKPPDPAEQIRSSNVRSE
ncbi:PREDICTED: vegetative cell wall protein gp1-like [Nicotiana attenuata]|uniref:Uncharacterized protein n=1 Tax=Nicotiana attenuata TaxID=49451 RepID=A0A1J6K8H1_NICAT|nr:PREDICTED: vegetative cell wall protein gp1-like [Nicotiana attenuata]OIT21296.1 hypothetical protein A4A49_37382 [Nicotiana attenuata]